MQNLKSPEQFYGQAQSKETFPEKAYGFKINEETGELDIEGLTDEEKQNFQTEEQEKQTQQPQQLQKPEQQQPDKFVSIQQQIDNLSYNVGNLLRVLQQSQQQQEPEVEPVFDNEATESLFGDADKGNKFITGLTGAIEQIIDKKMRTLQPIVTQANVQAEMNQVANQPDIKEYAAGMQLVLTINPQLSIPQAYGMAKQLGWKQQLQQVPPQQPQPQQPNNVRRLPPRLRSDNPQLQGSNKKAKEYTVQDAINDAADELGIAL